MAKGSTLVLELSRSLVSTGAARAVGAVGVLCVLSVSSVNGCAPAAAPLPPAEPAAIASTQTSARARPATAVAAPSFEHHAPVVGEHVRVRTHAISSYPNAEGVRTGEAYFSDYELRVMRVDGDALSEATVVFHTNERHAWHGANDDYNYVPKATPLEGKRLRIRAEPLSAEEDAGGAVSADIEKLALDVVSDIGMRGAMDAAIPDRVLEQGARVDSLAPALVRVLNPRTWHFESGGASLRELDADSGVFEVALHIRTESGSTLALNGEVTVRRRDRLVSVVMLKGTFEGGGGGDPLHGEMSYQRLAE
jgi:hypothetical protein